jgi:hypothetical protein
VTPWGGRSFSIGRVGMTDIAPPAGEIRAAPPLGRLGRSVGSVRSDGLAAAVVCRSLLDSNPLI